MLILFVLFCSKKRNSKKLSQNNGFYIKKRHAIESYVLTVPSEFQPNMFWIFLCFAKNRIKIKKTKDARLFNFTFKYILNILFINNQNFSRWDKDIKSQHTTHCIYLTFRRIQNTELSTYQDPWRDDLNFEVIIFSHLCSKILHQLHIWNTFTNVFGIKNVAAVIEYYEDELV